MSVQDYEREHGTGFADHTDLELLGECRNAISDLLEELGEDYRPKTAALLGEIMDRV